MVDGLPAVAAGIEDHSVAGVGDAFRHSDRMGLGRELSEQGRVTSQGSQIRMVLLRNHQHMNRRLRIKVAKCERRGAFQHDRSWYFARRDSAE